jgi:septal ring-binding cell division protein DamX
MREENGMRYHMIYGRYPTLTAARKALRKLPKTINKNRPWINDYPRAVKLVRLN